MKTVLSELDKETLVIVFSGYDVLLMREKLEFEEENKDGVFNPQIEEIERKRTSAKKLFARLYKNKR